MDNQDQAPEPTFNIHDANELINPYLDPDLLADKRRYRRLLTRIITIMLVIVFAILLFWLYLILKDTFFYKPYNQSTDIIPTNTPIPTPQPTDALAQQAAPTLTADYFKHFSTQTDTLGWTTYTNTKYQYQVKYPSNDYEQQYCLNEELLLEDKESAPPSHPPIECGRGTPYDFEITSTPRYTLEFDDGVITTTETVILDGINTTKYTFNLTDETLTSTEYNEGPSQWTVIKLSGSQKDLEIYSQLPDETLTQILSTFRFLDNTTPTPLPTDATSEDQSLTCGGIAAIPCPEGYTCRLDGLYPDASGTCVPSN